jgi:VIT1/CCC1 family predicted Fe2+/Mn2+ transporter
MGFDSLWLALSVGGIGLFVAGVLVARFTGRSWLLSGLRQLALGGLAAGATYLIGGLFE